MDGAEAVRSFYESYPYPLPIDSLDGYRRQWQDLQKRRADFHLFWPAKTFTETSTILIAGCGTSQAAKHALRWPHARVIGIDVSASSIRCTQELKRKYGLENLSLRQLPIERVSELEASFDQIICTGVLHHLPNPDVGLRALREVLNPNGAMHLMVYAPYGRAGIYMLQEFCKRVGIRATDDGIRQLVTALKVLPSEHPLQTLLREAPDFREAAALADALLHPQDRAYSVPELFDFIKKAGMKFGRWVRQAPYSLHTGLMAHVPVASERSKLSPEEQYSAVELFRGTMIRHSAIIYRDDSSYDADQISFKGDSWLDYVPIRVSEAICVLERLPKGAAAVLINPTHTYTDLFLPIDPFEKRLFELVDGHLSIRRFVDPRDRGLARGFFERLWLNDQVVFDSSRRNTLGGNHEPN